MTEQCRLEVAAELQQRWEGIPHSSSHLAGNTSGRRNFSTPATEDWRITEYTDRRRTMAIRVCEKVGWVRNSARVSDKSTDFAWSGRVPFGTSTARNHVLTHSSSFVFD